MITSRRRRHPSSMPSVDTPVRPRWVDFEMYFTVADLCMTIVEPMMISSPTERPTWNASVAERHENGASTGRGYSRELSSFSYGQCYISRDAIT